MENLGIPAHPYYLVEVRHQSYNPDRFYWCDCHFVPSLNCRKMENPLTVNQKLFDFLRVDLVPYPFYDINNVRKFGFLQKNIGHHDNGRVC